MNVFCGYLLLVFLLNFESASSQQSDTTGNQHGGRYVYTRDRLIELKQLVLPSLPLPSYDEIIKTLKWKRKRGKRGGVRQRIRRRGHRPPLPTIILSNVRSLRNKIDTLAALAKFDTDYRNSCVICLTETWLLPSDTNSSVTLDNFTLFRNDRDSSLGKSKGGGVCIYVNDRWCKTVNVNNQINTHDIELLSLSLRPHYLPREFNIVHIVVVYIPPSAKSDTAKQLLDEHTSSLLLRHPDSPLIIVGDFNHCQLPITGLDQFVTCKTRRNNTLDLCYCNIRNSYKSTQKQPIATSDHNTVHLLPTYISKLKREKPTIKQQSVWSPEVIERLNACFDCTLWDTLMSEGSSIEEWTDVVTNYINFCTDLCVDKRETKIFPNNKPWVTKRLKCVLNEKKIAFMSGDLLKSFEKEKEIRKIIKEEKVAYRKHMEKQLRSGSPMQAWSMIRQMGGVDSKKRTVSPGNINVDVDELNDFYCRFDTSPPTFNAVSSNNQPPPEIEEETVRTLFRQCKERKAPGPDKLTGTLLTNCDEQLAVPFTKLFQRSIDEQSVPLLWKTSVIVPIPKKRCPTALNDYRPVALTSIVMKCFEKIIKRELLQTVYDLEILDPLQFAYQPSLSVEDALLTVTNSVAKHLDLKPSNYARILYIDFSSAFNAMNTNTLLEKLCNIGIPTYLIEWYKNFLTYRPQWVKMDTMVSAPKQLSNGCPQGCVSSPILYILYTNDCRPSYENCLIVKYADDTAIVGLMKDEQSEMSYFHQIDKFVDWCQHNSLELNISKTKEQLFGHIHKKDQIKSVTIGNDKVEIVKDFKYLGVTISDSLNFKQHIDAMTKKLSQRLYILRKLRSFEVRKKTMIQVYNSLILSVISFGITVWYGGSGVKEKSKISRIIKDSTKIINHSLDGAERIYTKGP